MFGFMIVYPAGLLLGALVGLLVPFKSARGLAICSAAVGAVAALFAAWETRAFLAPDFGLSELLLQLTLPAAAICFVLGVIGTYLGSAVHRLIRWILRFVVETMRLG